MSNGMITCDVCGRDFALMAEDHYVARSDTKPGLSCLAGEVGLYDAVDCPHCGCQKLLKGRARALESEVAIALAKVEIPEEEEEEENE